MTPARLLVVCTADTSRGPAADVLLRDRLGPHVRGVEVWSAGTAADENAAVHPLTVEALSHIGLQIRAHTPRRLLADDVRGADLVLCAERMHRLHVARLTSGAASKAFTLAEFARLAPHLREAELAAMLTEANAMRAAHPAEWPGADDLADPAHGDHLDHARMVRRLADLALPISRVLTVAASHAGRHGRRARTLGESEVVLPSEATAPFER